VVAGVALAGLLSLAAGGGAASASQLGTHAPANEAINTFPTTGGTLFGGNTQLANVTTQLGRNLAIYRVYYTIGENFPTFIDNEHMSQGSTLLVSLDIKGQTYASIAAGQSDAQINTFLTAVNQAAIQYSFSSIFISFQHEPDNKLHAGYGTAAQFVEAWDHVHQLAVNANLDWNQGTGGRLMWTLILVHNTYGMGTNANGYWPGPGEVDIVAADGYNTHGCTTKPIMTPAQIFGSLLSFAAANGGLPVFLAEWASNAAQRTAQATFISQMQTYLTQNHKKIKAAMYWDDTTTNCSYKVDGNPGSIAALKTLGASADMQGTAHT